MARRSKAPPFLIADAVVGEDAIKHSLGDL